MLSELALILLPLSLQCGQSHCHTWVKQRSPGVCPAVGHSAFVSGYRHGALVTWCTSSLFQTWSFVCLCGHSGFDVCWGCSLLSTGLVASGGWNPVFMSDFGIKITSEPFS